LEKEEKSTFGFLKKFFGGSGGDLKPATKSVGDAAKDVKDGKTVFYPLNMIEVQKNFFSFKYD